MPEFSENLTFRKLGIVTISSILLLILVGGIVRSTGSGMGCPDWPRCFGKWVPPTDTKELPKGYKEIYSEKRKLKNQKIASYLHMLHLHTLGKAIAGDQSVYEELDFNPVKTWIEYLNRLLGVVIGLLIFSVLLVSFKYLSSDPAIFRLSLASFVLVALEGWLGSVVVSTKLLPFMVTLHMALSIILLWTLIYAVARSENKKVFQTNEIQLKNISIFIKVAIALSFIQILSGTQVREQIDLISDLLHNTNREMWISRLNSYFDFHRSFSMALAAFNVWMIYYIKKSGNRLLNRMSNIILGIIILEIALGLTLTYFSVPSLAQPFHLLLGCLLIGVQFAMYSIVKISNRTLTYKLA